MWFDDPFGDGRPPILFPKVRCGGRRVAWVRQFWSKELRCTAQRSLGSQPIDLGTVAPLIRERMEPQERAQAEAWFSQQKVETNTVSAVREIEEAVTRLRGAAENLKAMATSSNANLVLAAGRVGAAQKAVFDSAARAFQEALDAAARNGAKMTAPKPATPASARPEALKGPDAPLPAAAPPDALVEAPVALQTEPSPDPAKPAKKGKKSTWSRTERRAQQTVDAAPQARETAGRSDRKKKAVAQSAAQPEMPIAAPTAESVSVADDVPTMTFDDAAPEAAVVVFMPMPAPPSAALVDAGEQLDLETFLASLDGGQFEPMPKPTVPSR